MLVPAFVRDRFTPARAGIEAIRRLAVVRGLYRLIRYKPFIIIWNSHNLEKQNAGAAKVLVVRYES